MNHPLKHALLLLAALTGLCACTPWRMQIVTLENDKLPRNDSTWIYTDSLAEVWFNFYSEHGNDVFFVHNKNNKPVFVDLKNSFISVNNYKKDFWTDVSQVNESLTFKQYRALDLKTQNPINGTISRPQRIVMIPPNSTDVIKTLVHVKSKPYDLAGYTTKTDTVVANWTEKSKKTMIRSASFDRKNSPTLIRVFLSLSKTEDFRDPQYFDFYFWVSGIMEMDARQATKSGSPLEYFKGFYSVIDSTGKHPYKKSARFYIPEEQ